jgi:hypothetical protein
VTSREDQRIGGQTLSIDGLTLINCILMGCILEYAGTHFLLVESEIIRCRYIFYGPAKGTVHFLQSVGMMHPQPSQWGEFSDHIQ